jgi:RHH-type proline utilization regulon transcriptional repressor/proline dehydrogenase/delta 1-pyrroline-5-carboxylate dehydrogenase
MEQAQTVADHHPEVQRIEDDRPGGGSVIIVDKSADLDSAVLGVRRAAFGASDRMPHSCRRVVALQTVHDTFVQRLCESTRALRIGDPADPATDIGPVLDAQAQESINDCIAQGRAEAHAALAMELPEEAALMDGRHYVAPHIFDEVPPAGVLAGRPCRGPVLSIMKAASFPEALGLARSFTDTTAVGLYSRTPSHIEQAHGAFSAFDLFINRPVESVTVGRTSVDGVHLADAGALLGAAGSLRRFLRP